MDMMMSVDEIRRATDCPFKCLKLADKFFADLDQINLPAKAFAQKRSHARKSMPFGERRVVRQGGKISQCKMQTDVGGNPVLYCFR